MTRVEIDEDELERLRVENGLLRQIAADFHFAARRYADGRRSSFTALFNARTRVLLAMGVELHPGREGTIWARDAMGREYDHLTDAEAAIGEHEL